MNFRGIGKSAGAILALVASFTSAPALAQIGAELAVVKQILENTRVQIYHVVETNRRQRIAGISGSYSVSSPDSCTTDIDLFIPAHDENEKRVPAEVVSSRIHWSEQLSARLIDATPEHVVVSPNTGIERYLYAGSAARAAQLQRSIENLLAACEGRASSVANLETVARQSTASDAPLFPNFILGLGSIRDDSGDYNAPLTAEAQSSDTSYLKHAFGKIYQPPGNWGLQAEGINCTLGFEMNDGGIIAISFRAQSKWDEGAKDFWMLAAATLPVLQMAKSAGIERIEVNTDESSEPISFQNVPGSNPKIYMATLLGNSWEDVTQPIFDRQAFSVDFFGPVVSASYKLPAVDVATTAGFQRCIIALSA